MSHPHELILMPRFNSKLCCVYCWRNSVLSGAMYHCGRCKIYVCHMCRQRNLDPDEHIRSFHFPSEVLLYRDNVLRNLLSERHRLLQLLPTVLNCVKTIVAQYARRQVKVTRGTRYCSLEDRQFSMYLFETNEHDVDFIEQVFLLKPGEYELQDTVGKQEV